MLFSFQRLNKRMIFQFAIQCRELKSKLETWNDYNNYKLNFTIKHSSFWWFLVASFQQCKRFLCFLLDWYASCRAFFGFYAVHSIIRRAEQPNSQTTNDGYHISHYTLKWIAYLVSYKMIIHIERDRFVHVVLIHPLSSIQFSSPLFIQWKWK